MHENSNQNFLRITTIADKNEGKKRKKLFKHANIGEELNTKMTLRFEIKS